MKAKTAQKVRSAMLFGGGAIMLLSYFYPPLFRVGGMLAFCCFIPHFFFNKCPYCNELLDRTDVEYCHRCGSKIE